GADPGCALRGPGVAAGCRSASRAGLPGVAGSRRRDGHPGEQVGDDDGEHAATAAADPHAQRGWVAALCGGHGPGAGATCGSRHGIRSGGCAACGGWGGLTRSRASAPEGRSATPSVVAPVGAPPSRIHATGPPPAWPSMAAEFTRGSRTRSRELDFECANVRGSAGHAGETVAALVTVQAKWIAPAVD